jgi:hypothetical protein
MNRPIPHLLLAALLTLVALTPHDAEAEHGMPGMSTIPSKGSIPTNGRIRLMSTNGVSWVVSNIKRKTGEAKVALVGGGQRIPMRVTDAYDDMEGGPRAAFAEDAGYGDSVLVLAPTRLLRPRTNYELVASYRTNAPGAPWEPLSLGSWQTTDTADTSPPRWKEPPFVEWRRAEYADQPDDDMPVAVVSLHPPATSVDVLVEIERLSGGPKRRMIAAFDTDRAASWRNGVESDRQDERCQTVHLFDTVDLIGTLQRVTLTAVDIAGNATKAPGHPLVMRWAGEGGVTLCLRI